MAPHCAESNSYSQLLDLLQLGCGKRCFPGASVLSAFLPWACFPGHAQLRCRERKDREGSPHRGIHSCIPVPHGHAGKAGSDHPRLTRLDFTARGAGNLDAPAPGLTQSSPALSSATNHVGVGPGSPLGRQTAMAKPPRFSASTARSVSTATARGGEGGGLVRSEKRSEENRCFGFLVPAPPPPQDWQFLSGRDPGVVLLPCY